MHFNDLATIFLALSPLAIAAVIPDLEPRQEEVRADEAIFLVKCSKYVKNAKDASASGSSDKLFYYKDYNNAVLAKNQDDECFPSNPGPKEHSIDWTTGTYENPIKGQLDKKAVTIWGITERGDKTANTAGHAMFGGARFRCYANADYDINQDYGDKMYQKCYANYYCTREERQIRRTFFTVYENTEKIVLTGKEVHEPKRDGYIATVVDGAFGNLKTHMANNAADDTRYPLGNSGAYMTFTVRRSEKDGDLNFEEDRIDKVADLLKNQLNAKIYATDTLGECIKYPSGNKVLGTCKHTITFPKEILVQIQVADQQVLDWDDRDTVVIKVYSGKDCRKDSVGVKNILGAILSAGAAVSSGGFSAVAGGLGAIMGITAGGDNC
ncbi:hypothetical protein HYALB_00012530 [Hymenoscyphus albidus]|uniref:Uncharacterized protein n=1 Tax=Hymenoscyphus albidus TaxID=595503 RepID=A0A9N9LQG8_9HELO|nr:hypothetical protein HYALB_00012530 [Hymenoscyphus albidus]